MMMMRWPKPVSEKQHPPQRMPQGLCETGFISGLGADYSLILRENQLAGQMGCRGLACQANLGALTRCLAEEFIEFAGLILHFLSIGHGVDLLAYIGPDFRHFTV